MNVATTLELPAELMPDALAIGDGTGRSDAGCTYAELAAEAMNAAAWISAHVPERGRVMFMQESSRSFIAGLSATLAGGRIAAPVTTRARSVELAHLIESIRPTLIIADDSCLAVVEECLRARPVEGGVQVLASTTRPWADLGAIGEFEAGVVEDEDAALLMHTSGTTGLPKPVTLTHGGLTQALLRSVVPADGVPRGATLLSVPNNHVAGVVAMFVSLFSGRRLELLSPFTAARWLDAVARTGVSHAFVVPTMLQRILREPAFDATDLTRLETVAYGAAPMPTTVLVEALSRFPASCDFVGSYGQTETGGTVCVLGPSDHQAARAGEPAAVVRLRSIGKPIAGVEMSVVDEGGAPVPDGTVGHLVVAIDEGAARRTGDLGYRDDAGYLFLTSRADDLIIRAGENIDPAEVEQAIMTYPGVAEVAVAGLPDEEWGQIVAAFVVAAGHEGLDEAGLIAHTKSLIASYKAPARVFVIDELPRTELGKVKRRELAASSYRHP
jgi:acyl-CoA synthetase (AMP-forming)/AMP-acid ligase II